MVTQAREQWICLKTKRNQEYETNKCIEFKGGENYGNAGLGNRKTGGKSSWKIY